jgi:hypothetical protein
MKRLPHRPRFYKAEGYKVRNLLPTPKPAGENANARTTELYDLPSPPTLKKP